MDGGRQAPFCVWRVAAWTAHLQAARRPAGAATRRGQCRLAAMAAAYRFLRGSARLIKGREQMAGPGRHPPSLDGPVTRLPRGIGPAAGPAADRLQTQQRVTLTS
jgi:hypothetical protein